MEYVSPEDARDFPGLRLALTRDVPAPYSMSARSILDIKNVPYVAVEQIGGGANESLIAWTGHRNAPIALHNDEPPRVRWLEILDLAERLGDGPSLMPLQIEQRINMVGLVNELIGENGLVWQMRLIMLGLGGPERSAQAAEVNPMFAEYGYSEEARAQALAGAKEILAYFTDYARGQLANSQFLIGDQLSALDIYWVYFSQMINTLPHEKCPTPKGLRKTYDLSGEALGGCEQFLLDHRDRIIDEYIPLPMAF